MSILDNMPKRFKDIKFNNKKDRKMIKHIYWHIRHKFSKAYWYARGILWDKHHILKCKTLPVTYTDRDYKLLHFSFQILVDFCEKELKHYPVPHICSDICNKFDSEIHKIWVDGLHQQQEYEKEFWNLYHWWKVERVNQWEVFYSSPPHQIKHETEEFLNDKDDQMLKKLIDLRMYMWT